MTHDLDARFGCRSVGLLVAVASFSAMMLAAPAAEAESKITPHPGGFWKVHPPTSFRGEFGGEDPIGLAYKQHIPTDCSIVWKNGERFYCFSSQMSAQFVQENPDSYLPKAAAFWAKEHPSGSTGAKPEAKGAAAGPQQAY